MANVPTVAHNETTPAGTDYIREGDDRIREFKIQAREIIAIDHMMTSAGQGATWGMHKWCTFIEAADIGSGAAGLPILGAQTTDAKPELVFTDEDDNDVQLTKAGESVATVTPTDAAATTDTGILNKKYLDDITPVAPSIAEGTTDITRANAAYALMTDMSITITTTGRPVLVIFNAGFRPSGGRNYDGGKIRLLIDTVSTKTVCVGHNDASYSSPSEGSIIYMSTPTAAEHVFAIHWLCADGTIGQYGTTEKRHLMVIEL